MNRFRKFIPGTVVLSLMLLYFFFDAREGGFPRCPFNVITHLLCPGCGSQRALSALLHGDILEAAHFNILMFLFLPLVAVAAWQYLRNLFASQPKPIFLFHSNRLVYPLLALVLCFWILRNIPGFEWLQPPAP